MSFNPLLFGSVLGSIPQSRRDADDAEFGRALRAHFLVAERRLHRQRLTILGSLLAISLVINCSQLWLYVEALKVLCGGGR